MSTRQVLYIALLGLGLWGCRTPRGMLQAKEGQAPITPRPLSEIQVTDHIAVRDRDGWTSWEENGHTYEADMGWVTSVSPISYRTPLASRSVTGGAIASSEIRYSSAS